MGSEAKKQKPLGHRIGLYIRVSTEEQAVNPEGSIKNQEERLRLAVKIKNMDGHFGEIKAVFIDRAKSGKDTNRPELQKLLLAIRKREIDLVMVTELSRISRSIKDFSDIWELMKANDCGFYSNRENFDTTTAAGEMVLFTVANIAQFERRQISERVAANFCARAHRGLFNGGSIPFGYKRIPERPGFLEVDEDSAATVRIAFQTFLRERALLATAKWLNEQGFRLKREREGGGLRTRLGFFTVGNLKPMLKNRFYVGIKTFADRGQTKETEAVWPAIVERETFDRVNELLGENHRRNKDAMADRYPYTLTGLVSCASCGDRLVGKSAHGRSGKVGYYEHAWATAKGSHVPGLKPACSPYRVLAKQLEPAVWDEISRLLRDEPVARALLDDARKTHERNPGSKEAERCRQIVFSTDRQLETMAERLSTLPSSISPTPVYRQMEKLEGIKREAQEKLEKLESVGAVKDPPVELRDFRAFASALKDWLEAENSPKQRAAIARRLLQKIVVQREGCEIFFRVGETYVKGFLQGELMESKRRRSEAGLVPAGNGAPGSGENFEKVFGSNTCKIGRGDRI